MNHRLCSILGILFCLAFLQSVRAQVQLAFDSGEIDYSGVELLLTFKVAAPADYSHPFVNRTHKPLLEGGSGTWSLTRMGANFEVVPAASVGDDLVWTVRYRIERTDGPGRVTHDMTGFTVRWVGPLPPQYIAQDKHGNHVPNAMAKTAVTNRSRVDANGWTVLPIRTGTGVKAKAPDDPTLAAGLYAWYSPLASGYTPFYQDAAGTIKAENDGDPIGLWKDRSANGRDMSQSDPDLKPSYRDAASEVINDHPIVRFNGLTGRDATNLQSSAFALNASTGDISVAIVFRASGSSADANEGIAVFQDHGTAAQHGNHVYVPNGPASPPGRRGVKTRTAHPTGQQNEGYSIQEPSAGSPDGEWLVIVNSWDKGTGTTGTLRGWNLGAPIIEILNAEAAEADSTIWALGGTDQGFSGLNGDIVEVAIYNTALTDADAKALTQHFMDKYLVRPREIYVDASRPDDSGDGFTPATAKKTVAAGTDLVRDGVGDRCYFSLGSVFTDVSFAPQSGWSEQHQSVYGTFDPQTGATARPLFKVPQSAPAGILKTGDELRHVAIVGLDLYSYQRDPANTPSSVSDSTNGISLLPVDLQDILVEDCIVRWFDYNISLNGLTSGDDLIVRRNIVHNAYDTQTGTQVGGQSKERSSGIYLEARGSTRVLVEENTVHQNGWYDGTPLPAMGDPGPNIYSHNMYFQAVSPPPKGYVVRGNLSTSGASHGVQVRPGGVLDSNVFYRNAIGAFTHDNSNDNDTPVPSTTTPSLVWRNLFLQGRSPLLNWDGADYFEQGRNWGFEFNRGHDTLVTECIFALPTVGVFTSDNAFAVSFVEVKPEDRAFFRNNTIRVAQGNAIFRDASADEHAELLADRNIIDQPDSASGTRLADWTTSLSSGGPVTFAEDAYYSTAAQGQWFRVAGMNTNPSDWMTLTNDGSTSTTTSPEADFADLSPRAPDLGLYNAEVLGGADSPTALIASFLSRGRGMWTSDISAAAIVNWAREKYRTSQTLGEKGAVPHGW